MLLPSCRVGINNQVLVLAFKCKSVLVAIMN
jgi:hypothetical protein